jgi:uncharacterized protein YndB with AHSA1/START domain
MRPRSVSAILLLVLSCVAARAAVVDVRATGFEVKNEVLVHAPAERVYRVLTQEVGRWWNPEHTYSHDSANLHIDARPGGCFCERLPGGGGVEHLRVINVQPNRLLRFSGALGPLQSSGLAGALTLQLVPEGTATRLQLTYSAGGYLASGIEQVAPAVDAVLGEQIRRLQHYMETGTP